MMGSCVAVAAPPGAVSDDADKKLGNLGWALAIATDWDPPALLALLERVPASRARAAVLGGVGEGLTVTQRDRAPWVATFDEAADRAAIGLGK